MNIPRGDDKIQEYGQARDNAIASVGKMLIAHKSCLTPDFFRLWLTSLPLKYDKI